MNYSDWEDHATRREHMHDWSIASEMWLQAYNAAVDDEHKHFAIVRTEHCLRMKLANKVIH